MKFRKKPIVIDAVQFFSEKAWPEGVQAHYGDCLLCGDSTFDHICDEPFLGYRIKALEGWVSVQEGDWIITGVAGERYPCKPDIFEQTYEPAEDGRRSVEEKP